MNSIQNYSMTNYQQNNIQKNNSSFKAKFPLEDLEKLIQEQHKFGNNPLPEYPQLYTLLERLAEIKEGAIARLRLGGPTGGGWATPSQNPIIEIDGKVFKENIGGERGYYWFDTLKEAILGGTRPDNSEIPSFAMPNSVYVQTWWKNRKVTADDIRKLAIDA